jgi:hypothetical protein
VQRPKSSRSWRNVRFTWRDRFFAKPATWILSSKLRTPNRDTASQLPIAVNVLKTRFAVSN